MTSWAMDALREWEDDEITQVGLPGQPIPLPVSGAFALCSPTLEIDLSAHVEIVDAWADVTS